MAAPPPPPPPPPPGPINAGKPDNKKLLDSICKGTSLKKVPDSMKNDRSEASLSKPPGTGNSKNNSGPLVPPSNKPMTFAEELARRNPKATDPSTKSQKTTVTQIAPQVPPIPPSNKPMSITEELAARKNQKSNDFQSSPNMPNSKRGGAPLPNSLPPPVAPPPPSAVNKPQNIAQQTAPIRMPLNLPPPPGLNSSQPPPPPPNFSSSQPPPPPPGLNSTQLPPPPPPKDSKPNFRQPIPICSKPTINGDSQIRGIQPIIPPPPPPMFPSSNDVCPPRFGPPPPPPLMSFSKPNAPIREDYSFDSRFTFLEVKYFPDPNKMSKIRQT